MLNGIDGNNIKLLNLNSDGDLMKTINNERYNNNCYVISGSGSTNSTFLDICSIYNPSGSNKNVYIYSVKMQVSSANSINNGIFIELWTLSSQPTGGNTVTAEKIKLINGDSTTHSSVIKNTTVFTTVNKLYTYYQQFTSSTIDIDNVFLIDLYNEMIEIPEGYGIIIRLGNSSTSTVNYTYNIKFIEK